MEAWLAELALEADPASTFINNLCDEQNETMGITFDDQIVATLGHENFSYPQSAESNNTWFKCADFDSNIIEQFTPTQFFNNQDDIIINGNDYNNDNDDNYDNNNNNNNNSIDSSNNVNVLMNQQNNKACKEENNNKKEGVKGGTKRKRHPSQVQDHIIAERRRRELLSQLFISLSAIVPGLKKVDKTSVLGEAIKYMKQLQEKVKVLEEAAIKRTVVVFKNSQLTDDDDNGYSSTIDNGYLTASGGLNRNNNNNTNDDGDGDGDGDGDNNNIGGGESNNDANNYNDSLPEIEVKTISGKTILLRVNCEDQKGILAKLFTELDKHDLSVTNCSAVPFDTLGLDITIVAQIMERSFNNNVKDFIRSLRSTLRLRR